MEAPMSSSLGAMGPLLRKLDGLVAPDGSGGLPKLLKRTIEKLKMDLFEDIVSPLLELSEHKAPDLTAMYWMTEVRELSYDIEDSIDEMILAGPAATRSGAIRLLRMRRVRHARIPKLKRNKWIAKVAKLRTALREAFDRHERYLQKDDSSLFVFSTQGGEFSNLQVAENSTFVFSAQLAVPAQTASLEEKDSSSSSSMFNFSAQHTFPGQSREATNKSSRADEVAPMASAKLGQGSGSSRRVSRHPKQAKNRTRGKSESQEMHQQHYSLGPSSDNLFMTSQDKVQSPRRYGQAFNLVGVDDARIQLTNWIRCEENQALEVMTILGPGGIGKSTLAKELYREHGGQFIYRGFVRASRKPNIRKILWDILTQIQRQKRPTGGGCNVQNLIDNIRGHLKDKRYFIVIDDVWETTLWDIIFTAFPESNKCSRIIITSEMEDVALECAGYQSDFIFKMKPLENVDSMKLFMNIVVFGSEWQQNRKELKKTSYEIARKCGGLPLATKIIAGLARFSAIQKRKLGIWSHIQNLLSIKLTSSGLEEMMKEILHFCYDNLPPHLKTCLLYLGMYPEGHIILKADLVKQWIAEGFICTIKGKDKEEIAESYFNDLINIGLIHPDRIKYIDGAMSCTVHPMVLNMIKCKSREVNFITVTDYPRVVAGLSTKVRRLSVQLSSTKHASNPATVALPHVRSLTYFGLLECSPLVASLKFKLLRVLVIEIWGEHSGWTSLDFTRISALLHLIYLKITSDVMVQLPDKISGLQHLESFEVDARVSSVPSDIIRLPRLSQLRIKDEIKLPDGIGSIRSLHTLQYFDIAENSKKNVRSLGELSNLRDLHLTFSTEEHLNRNLDALSSALEKLRDLCSLTLAPGTSGAGRIPLEGSITFSSVPVSIQRLKLLPPTCIFSRLPGRIGVLRKLRVLKIAVKELLKTDINDLSRLPALTVLSLHVRVVRVATVIIERGSFPALRYFKFRSNVLTMAFRAGAMPNLYCLKLGFKAQRGKKYGRMLGGVEHLVHLKEITGEISNTTGACESDWRAAVSAFHDTVELSRQKWSMSQHPSFPTVLVKLADWLLPDEACQELHQEEGAEVGATTTLNRVGGCNMLQFPVELLPEVISYTSPLDACRCSTVCTAFGAAAMYDQVWDRFFPQDYRSILSRAIDPLDFSFASTKKELFISLAKQPILIDQGKKSFWLERANGAKCYMLASRGLQIAWGDTPKHWRWIALPDSRFEEVAELVDVCWFDIIATINCRDLSVNTRYAAYLVFNFKLCDEYYGLAGQLLDSSTQEAFITIAGQVQARHTVSLDPTTRQEQSRVGSSSPSWGAEDEEEEKAEEEGDHEEDENEEGQDAIRYPIARGDGWMEVEMGEFCNENLDDGDVEIRLKEHTTLIWKCGLIIEGIEIRPKIGSDRKATAC